MSVPEALRRRNSTMFVGHEPLGYENTEFNPVESHIIPRNPSAARAHICALSTPECKEMPIYGCPTGTACLWRPALSATFKRADTVPALFSSPNLHYYSESDPLDDRPFEMLPEVVSDSHEADIAAAVANGENAVTHTQRTCEPGSTLMQCLKCHSVGKGLFVDELQEGGGHYMHRSQTSCTCRSAKTKPAEHNGPVLVSRGAW